MIKRLSGILLAVLLAGAVLHEYHVAPNDDAFVYFTYARNMALGRFFAYDVRGIPSEGFTSLFYMLSLVPFEITGVNIFFGAVLLGLAALAATIYLGARIISSRGRPLLFIPALVLLGAFFTGDREIRYLLGATLETAWAPVFVLAVMIFAIRLLDEDTTRPMVPAALMQAAAFASILVRPENLATVAAIELWVFLFTFHRKTLIASTGIFFGLLAALAAFKLVLFHDIFPTGYYRKLASPLDLPGLAYSTGYIKSYMIIIVPLAMLTLILLRFEKKEKKFRVTPTFHAIMMPIIYASVNFLFVLAINPIVGGHWRYFYGATVSMYILLSMAIFSLVEHLGKKTANQSVARHGAFIAGTAAVIIAFMLRGITPAGALKGLEISRLESRCEKAMTGHQYIRFGTFLKTTC